MADSQKCLFTTEMSLIFVNNSFFNSVLRTLQIKLPNWYDRQWHFWNQPLDKRLQDILLLPWLRVSVSNKSPWEHTQSWLLLLRIICGVVMVTVSREGPGYLGNGTGCRTTGTRTPCRGTRSTTTRWACRGRGLGHKRPHSLTHPRGEDELFPQLNVCPSPCCNR